MMAEDLSLDLEELRLLHTIAKRPRVISLITSQIRTLEQVPIYSLFFSLYLFPLLQDILLSFFFIFSISYFVIGFSWCNSIPGILLSDLSFIVVSTQLSEQSAPRTPTPIPVSTSIAKVPINSSIVYTPLPGFSWDQDNDKVKVTEFKPFTEN